MTAKENIIKIPIEPNFAGNYRLEYDGKYITLFGGDKKYRGYNLDGSDDIWYEEMVLISCVKEIRNANPIITDITESEIIITLNKEP